MLLACRRHEKTLHYGFSHASIPPAHALSHACTFSSPAEIVSLSPPFQRSRTSVQSGGSAEAGKIGCTISGKFCAFSAPIL